MSAGSHSRDSILVTGCSTGFGLETAVHLAERGFRVFATMRDPGRRQDLDAAAKERGVELEVLELDVTDRGSIEAAVATVVERAGGLYGLVNNAGLLIRGYFEDLLDSEIRSVFETNLFGTMAVTRAVLPHLRAAGRGRVIVVTSVAGKVGAPTGTAYGASRFALEGFAESLSQEIGPLGLRVIVVAPGMCKTQRWTLERGAAARARQPDGPYYEWFQRAEELFDRAMEASPIQPSDVARTIGRALTARRPRLRYAVGRRAAFVVGLRRHLPGELFERIYFGEVMRRVTGGRARESEPGRTG